MPTTATNKATGEQVILVEGQWKPFSEDEFQRTYGFLSRELGLDPNPDAPEHLYDYRSALASGKADPLNPEHGGHWPSQFKAPEHPNRYVDGIDTISGNPAKTATNPKTGEKLFLHEGVKQWLPLETKQQGEKRQVADMDMSGEDPFGTPPEGNIKPLKTLIEGTKDVARSTLQFVKGSEEARDIESEAEHFGVSGDRGPLQSLMTPKMRQEIIEGREKGLTDVESLESGRQQVVSDVKSAIDSKWLKPDQTLKRPEGFAGYVQDVIRMAPQITSQVGATVATGPAGGGAFMATQIAGSHYESMVEEGVRPERAFKAAVTDAILQTPLEQLAMGKALKMWKPGKSAGKFLKGAAEAGFVGWFTEMVQKYPELATDIWAKGEGLTNRERVEKFIEGSWQAFKEGAYEGAVAAPFEAILGGAGAVSQRSDTKPESIEAIDKDTKGRQDQVNQEIKEQILNDLVNQNISIEALEDAKADLSADSAQVVDDAIAEFKAGKPNKSEVEKVKSLFPAQTPEEQADMEFEIRKQQTDKARPTGNVKGQEVDTTQQDKEVQRINAKRRLSALAPLWDSFNESEQDAALKLIIPEGQDVESERQRKEKERTATPEERTEAQRRLGEAQRQGLKLDADEQAHLEALAKEPAERPKSNAEKSEIDHTDLAQTGKWAGVSPPAGAPIESSPPPEPATSSRAGVGTVKETTQRQAAEVAPNAPSQTLDPRVESAKMPPMTPEKGPGDIPTKQASDQSPNVGPRKLDKKIHSQALSDLQSSTGEVRRSIQDAAEGVILGAQTRVDYGFDTKKQGDGIWPSGDEVYDSFQNTRNALKKRFGKKVRLFRLQGEKENIPNKHTLNWVYSENLLEEFNRAFGKDRELLFRSIPVDDIVAINVGEKGRYEEFIVLNRDSEGLKLPENHPDSPNQSSPPEKVGKTAPTPSVEEPQPKTKQQKPPKQPEPQEKTGKSGEFAHGDQVRYGRGKYTLEEMEGGRAIISNAKGERIVNVKRLSPWKKTEKKAEQPTDRKAIGFAWIKNQQRAITFQRKITRGKNKGKFKVVLADGKSKVADKIRLDEPKVEQPQPEKEEVKPDVKPETAPIEIEGGKDKTVSVDIPKSKADNLSLAQQKKYLYAEIDKAIKQASNKPGFQTEGTKIPIDQKAPRGEYNKDKFGTITIEVPGDGEFTVVNHIIALHAFRKGVGPAMKGGKGYGVSKPSARPSGKRIKGVDYYNEFKPRKEKIIENTIGAYQRRIDNYYRDGYFSDGVYTIKLDSPSTLKKKYVTGDKSPNVKKRIIDYYTILTPANVVGELYNASVDSKENIGPFAHVVAEDGRHVIYQAKHVDSILTKYPNAEPNMSKEGDLLIFRENGETVAAIMPTRLKIRDFPDHLLDRYEEITGDKIEDRKKPEKKAEPTKPGGAAKPTKTNKIAAIIKNEEGSSQLLTDVVNIFAKDQTETKAFKDWFGDSKVIDSDGKPLVVYHGTGESFDTFRHGWSSGHIWGRGFYFAESRTDAEHYAEIASRKTGESYTMPVYLSIKNPVYIEVDSCGATIFDGLPEDFRAELKSRLDADHDQGLIDAIDGDYVDSMELEGLAEEVQDYAEDIGYDGFIGTYAGDQHYMAFKPTQIKSATGNTGKFDPQNPSIIGESQLIADVAYEAANLIRKGIDTYRKFYYAMKKRFKDAWSKIKKFMRQVWDAVNNQKGGTTLERPEPKKSPKSVDLAAKYFGPKKVQQRVKEKEQFDKDLQQDTAETIETLSKIITPKTIGSFFRPGKLTKEGKQDLSYMWDLIVSVPEFFKQKIPGIGKIYQAQQDRQDEYHELIYALENNGDVNVGESFKRLKKDKTAFKAVQDYLNNADRTGEGFNIKMHNDMWTVFGPDNKIVEAFEPKKIDKGMRDAGEEKAVERAVKAEADHLAEQGYTPQQIEAVTSFRMTTNKGFELLFNSMRRLRLKYQEFGMELPDFETFENGEKRMVTLDEAMSRMGDMRGTYFPRIRPTGRFILTAIKGNDRILRTFKTRNFMASAKTHYEGLGYTVETSNNRQLGEDVFELSGDLVKTQQIVEAALDRANQATSKPWVTGDTEVTQKIDEITKDLQSVYFNAVSEQIANIIRGRGSRVHMTKRNPITWKGYEENPQIAIAKYIRGLAGGEAKRNATMKMLHALTGTDISWKQFKDMRQAEGQKKVEYDEYQELVREKMISARDQKNAFKWAKAYISEMTRNREMADEVIGTVKGIAVGKYLAFRVFSAPLVNLTALPTSVVATLKGAGIPYAHAWKHLGRGMWNYTKFLKYRRTGKTNDFVFKTIKEKGWDNPQFSSESIQTLRSQLGKGYDKAIDVGMFTFSESERLNRVATIYAAYHGLKAHGNTKGKSDLDILEDAKELSDKSHGVYNKGNHPYIAMGSNPFAQLARMFYVFRTFSHTYLLNMRRLGMDKQFGAVAHMALAPAVIAGAGASVMTPIISGLLKAFGFADEPEEELYAKVGEAFGPTAEAFARHGLAGAGGKGVSIKGSLAIGVGDLPTKIQDLLGAPGSVLKDFYYSGKSLARGDVLKGTEKALPTGFGNIIRGYREYTEGLTTWNNAPKFYGPQPLKASKAEAFYRVFSMNPARLAGIAEKQWKERKVEDKYKQWRTDIYAKLRRFIIEGRDDDEKWAELIGEVAKFNEKAAQWGLSPITAKTIRSNMKTSFKPSKRERRRATN